MFRLISAGSDRSQDKIVTAHHDEENKKVHWEGMPPEIAFHMDLFSDFDQKRRPVVCIKLAII